ncbi:hypothetical protein JRG66_01345 [Salinimicrobium tongyeongense]|uniref:Uncharacterized protein n=1 Tax=Salinimicrobium tongyeongense TaxID=2809707 RepID=A0ABY6NRN3_9FLAO|nr:hypothetical protein [Salinimicrobium tongyeongense]UZH55570.1 hypothetical protein JRG66_01345 [Salinimicrobium tongyeongense]
MNKLLTLLAVLLLGLNGYSQELNSPGPNTLPELNQENFTAPEEVFTKYIRIQPSLSVPIQLFPENQFSLKEISFDKKEQKRQVNLVSMMEKERYEKEKGLVELDSPLPTISKGEKALIEITNEIRAHDRSSNYDIYTGQKKIPAYEEMRAPIIQSPYRSRSGIRGYISPYPYSPFLR